MGDNSTTTTISISNTTDDYLPCDFDYPSSASAAFVVISIVIVMENIIGIAVIYSTPVLHTTANVFVCSMAVTDLAAGLSCILANSLILASKLECVSDNFAAYGLMTMLVIFAMVILSCAHMAMIALERYTYIAHPFFYRKHLSHSTIVKILSIFWTICALYVSALFIPFFSNIDVSPCSRQMPEAWGLMLSLTVYYISLCISTLCYGFIGKVVMAYKRRRVTQQSSFRLDGLVDKGLRRATMTVVQKDKMFRETMKTVSFFGSVFSIFIIFTLPPATLFIVDLWITKVENKMFRLFASPAILNSGVNFLVLSCFCKQFNESLRSTIKRFCSRSE